MVSRLSEVVNAIQNRIASIPPLTPEQQAARACREADERRREHNAKLLDAWQELAVPMGKRYHECRLENFEIGGNAPHAAAQLTVLSEIRKYAQNIRDRVRGGQGLVLYGPSGTGKDHLLTGLARAAIGAELSIRWANGTTLYRSMREGMGEFEEALIYHYAYPCVLYLSDPIPPVGSLTPFQSQTLFSIIDQRYRDNKPTWVALNVTDGQEASHRLGEAIADRLRDGALSLNCCWPSYRKGTLDGNAAT